MRCLVALLVCFCLVDVTSAAAQERVYHAQSGRPIAILEFFSCGPRMTPPNVSGSARNGTVTTRYTTTNRCGNPHQPTLVIVYTSAPGFRGQDEAIVHGFGNGVRRRIIVR